MQLFGPPAGVPPNVVPMYLPCPFAVHSPEPIVEPTPLLMSQSSASLVPTWQSAQGVPAAPHFTAAAPPPWQDTLEQLPALFAVPAVYVPLIPPAVLNATSRRPF